MNAHSAPLAPAPAYFALTTDSPERPRAWPGLAQLASLLVGLTFVAASVVTNVGYALSRAGDDPATRFVLAAVAIGASGGLALAVSAMLGALSRWQIGRALVCASAVAVFGAYSVAAALGSQGGHRLEATAGESERAGSVKRAQRDYDAALAELEALAPSRPVAELEAEVTGLLLTPAVNGCRAIEGKAASRVCPKVAALRVELGRAQRRAELEGRVAVAKGELAPAGSAPRIANTDAVVIAEYLRGFGVEASPDSVSRALVVLAVLVLELGGGLCFAVAAVSPRQPAPRAVAVPAQVEATAPIAEQSGSATPPTREPVRGPVADRIVELARTNGGRVPSVRGLAAMLDGVSKSAAHRALGSLVAAGVLVKSGSSLALAA